MQQPEIIVKIKSVYGTDTIYPVCAYAEEFAKLARTKTLTQEAIKSIRALGFKVVVEQQSI